MADQNSDDTRQNATARPGAEAAGGVEPQPQDHTDPQADAARDEAADAEMRRKGFGDHKGASIDAQ